MTLLLMLLLKSLLVFAFAGAALLCLRRASAAARHLVCLLTLVSLLALPLFSLTLPGWHLPVPAQAQVAETALPEPTPSRPSPPPPKREGEEFQASPLPDLTPRPPVSGGPLRSEERTKQGGGFLALYLIGLLLASFRPLLGLWGVQRLHRLCVNADDTPTLDAATDCAALLRLQTPRLCRADVPVPMTWGGRRPVVLLPTSSLAWPEDRLRSVLLHEMAHIKRRDWSCHRFADLVCALYWFHPLVWLTARRLRIESELACDDLVLASGIPAADYARHLLEIAGSLRPASRASQTAIAMAQTSRIEERLTMILDKTRSRRPLTRRILLFALLPVTAVVALLAVLRPTAHAQTEASPLPAAALETQILQPEPLSAAQSASVPVELVGVTDSKGPGSKWWSRSGQLLARPVFDTANAYQQQATTQSAGDRSILFAFRLPPSARDVTAKLVPTDSAGSSSAGVYNGKIQGHENYTEASLNPDTGGVRTLSATYPPTMSSAALRAGVAAGPWKVSALKSNVRGGTSGEDIEDQKFVFSDVAETANGVSLAIATDSAEDIQVVVVDKQGHKLLPTAIGDSSIDKLEQITVQFSLPLSQVKEFRVETRPFVWTEFKNVALHPSK